MHFATVNLSDRWSQAKWPEMWRDLDQLARYDFAPALRALRAEIDDDDLPLRKIPFVPKYLSEVAGQYEGAFTRRFRLKSAQMAEAVWRKLGDVYETSAVDEALVTFERALWLHNSAMLLPVPEAVGRVGLQVLSPWQVVQVDVADPLKAHRVEGWARIVLLLPGNVRDGVVEYEHCELTPTEAWRTVRGQRVGLYAQDGTHPLGRIPLVLEHRVPPMPGCTFAGPNEAVLSLAIALCVNVSDSENVIRSTAFPQRILTGGGSMSQIETITLGPNKIPHIPNGGVELGEAPPKLEVVQGVVPVAELVQWVSQTIMWSCQLLDLNVDAFLKSNTATTASARLFSAQDRKKQHDKAKPKLLRAETKLAGLLAQWLSLSELVAMPWQDIVAEVTWADAMPVTDAQSAIQTQTATYAAGLSTPDEDVAKQDGISLTKARALVDERIKRNRELGLVPVPKAAGGADAGSDNGDGGDPPAPEPEPDGQRGSTGKAPAPARRGARP